MLGTNKLLSFVRSAYLKAYQQEKVRCNLKTLFSLPFHNLTFYEQPARPLHPGTPSGRYWGSLKPGITELWGERICKLFRCKSFYGNVIQRYFGSFTKGSNGNCNTPSFNFTGNKQGFQLIFSEVRLSLLPERIHNSDELHMFYKPIRKCTDTIIVCFS